MTQMVSPGEPRPLHVGDHTLSMQIRGWILGVMLFSTAFLGSVYILTPLVPIMLFYPRMWRTLVDRFVGFWVAMPACLLEYLFGTRVRVIGDKIEHSDPGLIIMNHRTRLDWLFFWAALYKMDPWLLTSEKISLKGILKYIPGAGWAMQCNSFIFLDRAFSKDETKMNKMLDYYAQSGFNYQLLLFPEGTDKCPIATGRSKVHAKEKGLVHYDYVLHARTTGFVHMIQRMRRSGYIKYLYDVTIGFEGVIAQSEYALITHGLAPHDVHYQVIKIPIDSLPSDNEGLAAWLVKRWAEKEQKLKEFYSREDKETSTFENTPNGCEYHLTPLLELIRVGVCLVWLTTSLMWIYFFFTVQCMFHLFFISIAFFIGSQYVFGGVEWLAIDRFNALIDKE